MRLPARQASFRWLVIGIAVLLVGITGNITALAVHNLDFALQGDVTGSPNDWTTFFEGKGSYNGGTNAISIIPGAFPKVTTNGQFLNGAAFPDYALPDPTTFATGSKDILPISGNGNSNWQCASANNVGDKVDIVNAYATVFLANAGATSAAPTGVPHTILYFGMENSSPNGDRNLGIWLLQDPSVSCSSASGTKTFTGVHTDGDLLFAAAFTGGGGKPTSADIVAYRWNGDNLTGVMSAPIDIGQLCSSAPSGDLACAITNSTSSITTPWSSPNKASSGSLAVPATVGAQTFFEGGIDITGVAFLFGKAAPCFATFLNDTRSSQSTTATLFDFVSGFLPTCGKPTINTTLSKSQITVGQSVIDSATLGGVVIGTPSGTVTYTVYVDSACKTAATTQVNAQPPTVTLDSSGNIPNSQPVTFLQSGSYYWQAVYSGGGVNPGATSACTSELLVVAPIQPNIVTTVSSSTIVIGSGNSFYDTANVTGGYFPAAGTSPDGTVTFNLYGPFTSTPTAGSCTASIQVTSNVAATASDATSASYTTSATPYTPAKVGIYQFVATYNGNSNNLTASTSCGDTSEQVTVTPATPSLATTILLSDTVKVTGVTGAGPVSGTVVFTLYPSVDCTGTPVSSPQNGTLDANGMASTTTPVPVNSAGTYSWKVDFTPSAGSNYAPSTTCTEQATIAYQSPSPITPPLS